jgi:hypothetical protein
VQSVSQSVWPITSDLLNCGSIGAVVKQLRKKIDQVFSLEKLEEVCRAAEVLQWAFIHAVVNAVF